MIGDFCDLYQHEIAEALRELEVSAFANNINNLPLSPQLIDGIATCGVSLDAGRIAES